MEYPKGSPRNLPRTTQLEEESLQRPLLTGPSGGSPSRSCTLFVSKVLPNLVVALLLLLLMGMLMYDTNCSFSVLVSLNDSSDSAPHSKFARYESISSTTAVEMRLHRRLRGIAQYLSISPAAADEAQVQYDAAPPSALLTQDSSIPEQVLASMRSRGLPKVEQVEGEPRWPNLGFEKKMHPMPNGPDPIHNR